MEGAGAAHVQFVNALVAHPDCLRSIALRWCVQSGWAITIAAAVTSITASTDPDTSGAASDGEHELAHGAHERQCLWQLWDPRWRSKWEWEWQWRWRRENVAV